MTINDYSITNHKSKRILWLDVARTFAILCVVLCHSVEHIYPLNLESISAMDLSAKYLAFFAFTIGRLGVPIFFFISGYLLLSRNFDSSSCLTFWKKNLVPLLICSELWILIINIYFNLIRNTNLDISDLLLQMLFLKNFNISHLWYLPVIVGIYVFIPFISKVLNNFDPKLFILPYILAYIGFFIIPMINLLFQFTDMVSLRTNMNVAFVGGSYGLYLVTGFFISKGYFDKINKFLLFLTSLIALSLAVVLQVCFYSKGFYNPIWYDSPLIFITSFCIFLIFKNTNFEMLSSKLTLFDKSIKQIALLSFGIYMVHKPILDNIVQFNLIEIRRSIKLILVFFVAFVLSWILVEVLNKIPRLGKILLLIKNR